VCLFTERRRDRDFEPKISFVLLPSEDPGVETSRSDIVGIAKPAEVEPSLADQPLSDTGIVCGLGKEHPGGGFRNGSDFRGFWPRRGFFRVHTKFLRVSYPDKRHFSKNMSNIGLPTFDTFDTLDHECPVISSRASIG